MTFLDHEGTGTLSLLPFLSGTGFTTIFLLWMDVWRGCDFGRRRVRDLIFAARGGL